MTSEAQDAALATLSSSVASESTLIATFYSRRDAKQTRALHAHLFRALAHVSQATAVPTDWQDSGGNTFLHSFNPSAPSAHDTTVIQLALNESGVAIDAWRTLRHRLEHIVDATVLEGIWGYTLIYQAVLAPNVGAVVAGDPTAALV